ncbi:MAG: peptidylprolyl isomerase [Bacteroidota bacterium]
MKKIVALSVLVISSLISSNSWSQSNDPILMTIGGDKITKSEFESVYKKNNVKTDAIDKKSLEEYLDLYVNFKLKVKEADELGLDTVSSFVSELKGYRKQLAQPYLTDKEVTNKILEEAYERSKWDVRASHILIKVEEDALPKDTLIAYNKIIAIRDRALKGEDFGKLAVEFSDDPSAKGMAASNGRPAMKGNSGDLGYFTVFQMVYPFERAAFTTEPGKVSMPVRTKFGYHILKIVDKRPARGQITVAHIMIRTKDEMTSDEKNKAKDKIFEIYEKANNNEDFADLAMRFSDDKGSGAKGGVLPAFGTGRMVPEFEEAAFALQKNGDISKPFQTMYGWHIIKRIEKKDIPTFDESKNDLKLKISRDSRAQLPKEAVIEKLKKEYKFKLTKKSKDDFYSVVDSTIFKGTWAASKADKLSKTVFKIADVTYSQKDFANYIESRQTNRPAISIEVLVNQMFDKFVEEKVLDYEDTQLERKYADFKSLMKEYRDGILLFELTDQKVWSKAVKDSTGLMNFYTANKDNYMWGKRIDATIYTCANETIAKTVREKLQKQGIAQTDLLEEINKDSQLNLKIESTIYSKDDNKIIDGIDWKVGTTENIHSDNSVVFVVVKEILNPQPKTLAEAKGIITADYQNYLEKQWINSLKSKYKVEINKDVLSTIK